MASTYTAADIAAAVVPDMSGFFSTADAKIRAWEPPNIVITPEIHEPEGGGGGGEGGGPLAALGLVAAGAALGVLVGKAISSAIDFEGVQAKLAVQLGGSPQYAKEMGAIAGKLYAGAYGDSLEGVNDALRAVVQSGALAEDATNDEIQGVTAKVLDLSSAFGVDATEGAKALGQMMKTGMAPDAQTALDVITRGFQQGVDKSGDFLDTLNEYGVQFQKLGIDGATATGILSQGLKGGARDADLVADALKEFSIRAVDGSTTSAAGFKALGIDAEAMTKQIAGGGAGASAGLQIVLDKLRAMKDPVAQAATATALFGTQSEDLGKALYSIDPSHAVDALGKVSGAADQMDKTLGETASSKIESFKRSLETSLVDVIGNRVIPAITFLAGLGGELFGPAWDGVRSFLGFMATTGAGVAGVILAVAGAIKVWAGIQAAWNAIMLMNPVVLFVAALAGLVVGIIWAYNNVEWFRDGVDAVFAFIGSAATFLWENILSPVVDGIVAGWTAVATGASWLWENVLAPVFGFIGEAARILIAIILTILIAPFVLAFNLLAMAATWFWDNVLHPVFDAIGTVATWLWENILSPVFGAIGVGWQVLVMAAQAYWDTILHPVFSAIAEVATWLWENILSPVFDAIAAGWHGLLVGLGFVWDNVLHPVFDAIVGAVHAVADGFGWAVDRIRDVWGAIQGIVKPPIDFVVNVVYNNGIRPAWNFIAGIFDLGELPELHFAEGGVVPGQDRGYDTVLAALRPQEGILVPEATRMLGGAAGIHAINSHAKVQGYADGGVVGDILGGVGDFFGGLVDFVTDPVGAVRKAFAGIATGGLGGAGQLSTALLSIPTKAIDGAIKKVQAAVEDFFTSSGASGDLGQWIATAMAWTGVPASWAGPLNTLIMRESGGNPRAFNDWDSNYLAGIPSQGLMQTVPGTFAGYRDPRLPNDIFDPIANIVAGINYIKATYGTIFNVQQAVGSTPKGYDSGGYLPEGYSTVYNGTGKPEPVLTPDQWDKMAAGGGTQVTVIAREPLSRTDMGQLADEVQRRADWSNRRK